MKEDRGECGFDQHAARRYRERQDKVGGGPHENRHSTAVSGQELTTRPEAHGGLKGVFFFPSAKPRARAQFEGQSEESRKDMILF